MKRFTMVMRCGDPKDPAEAMHYTLIGEDYSVENIAGAKLVKAIVSKQIEVTNLDVTDKGLVATNGAMKNYTLIDKNGALVNGPKAVILNRVENDKGLVGYTMYGTNGTLQEVGVSAAAGMATSGLIANGKIRHTSQGDIVASINGVYPLVTIALANAKEGEIKVDVLFIGSAISGRESTKYAGLIVSSKSAASATKIHSTLVKANEKVISKVTEMGDTDAKKTLGIKVTGTAGFYGVYPISTAFELIEKAGNKVSLPMDNLIIACTDYDADKAEANVVISPSMKVISHQEGSAKANKALRGYSDKVLEKFKDIKYVK